MKKLSAFTLIEITTAMLVLGVIIAITVFGTFKSSKIQEKVMITSSRTFYNATQVSFGEIIRDVAQSGIKNLTSEELMNYFVEFMEGTQLTDSSGNNGDCSSFVGGDAGEEHYITEDTKCARFAPKIIAGFYVDPDCAQTITVKEYYQDDMDPRSVSNACGYIVYEAAGSDNTYGSSPSRGIFGTDLFVIGLGNRRLK